MGVRAELLARLTGRQIGTADFGGPQFDAVVEAMLTLTDGADANEADILFADERSIGTGANDDIDLAGSLSNAFGSTITAAEMVAMLIINKPRAAGATANTTNITVGVGSNPWLGFVGGTSPTIGPIRPGGFLFAGCPAELGIGVVSADDGDILRLANSSGATALVQVAFLARSTTG